MYVAVSMLLLLLVVVVLFTHMHYLEIHMQ